MKISPNSSSFMICLVFQRRRRWHARSLAEERWSRAWIHRPLVLFFFFSLFGFFSQGRRNTPVLVPTLPPSPLRSRCNIHMKNGKVYMKHNSLGDDVPIVVILRAMGAMSDQEIVQLVRGGVMFLWLRVDAGQPRSSKMTGRSTSSVLSRILRIGIA